MSENNQHTGPKQDTGENVAISSAPITKLKNNGGVAKILNREVMVEKLGNVKTVRKSLKVLKCEYCGNRYCIKCLKFKPGEYEAMEKPGCMWFCLKCKPKIKKIYSQ